MARKVSREAATVMLLAALAGALTAFERGAVRVGPLAPAEASPLESYTGFALKLSLAAGLGSRNTAVSPFSVYPALLMLSEGAAGDTKAARADDHDRSRLHQLVGLLQSRPEGRDGSLVG